MPKAESMNGSYKSYYSKRNSVNGIDERINLLDKAWIAGKRVLDVGCNSGKITIEIAQKLEPYRCTGVDIDKDLIHAAKKQTERAFSAQKPLPTVMSAEDELYSGPVEANYFPACFSRMYDTLPYPPSDYLIQLAPISAVAETRMRNGKEVTAKSMQTEVRLFPRNVKFTTADWVNKEIEDDKNGYDLVLALSVSKWIHLNQGDEGLILFFTRVFEVLRPSGRFMLEPQPIESYANARKNSQTLQANYANLKLRPADFERILLDDIGFKDCTDLGKVGRAGFKRSIVGFHWPVCLVVSNCAQLVFTKAAGSWI